MGHDHRHSPHSHEHSDLSTTPSETDKLVKIMAHWISHNEDHARSYREWAERAGRLGQTQVAQILQSVADDTLQQNHRLAEALAILQGQRAPH